MIHAAKLDWIEARFAGEKDQLVFQDDMGDAILELDMPAGLMRKLVDGRATMGVFVNLDGTVWSTRDESVEDAVSRLALDDLVERDLAPDMLEDEPDALVLLHRFEQRLRRCLNIVGSTMTRLQAQKQP